MKETRYTYNAEKENATFAVKLRNLFEIKGATHKGLAEYIREVTGESITRQAISQWCNGSTCPNIKTVPVIAEFFSVSTDYLLTDVKLNTTDPDFKAACKYTGLNEEAVDHLHQNPSYAFIINHIISSGIIFEIASAMYKLDMQSYTIMTYELFQHNFDTIYQLMDTLKITFEQAEKIVNSYVNDKYKMSHRFNKIYPTNSPYQVIDDDIDSINLECDTLRYQLIKCSEKISSMFDHREEDVNYTFEELMEDMNFTDEEVKRLREEGEERRSMADQDGFFDDMDTEEIMDDRFLEDRMKRLQEEEAEEEQNNGEHNSTQE